jgi:hypothetical protein
MVTIMDSDRFIDSIRLLTCKYRILHSSADWLKNFCTGGGLSLSFLCPLPLISSHRFSSGISVLVENMDNRLDKARSLTFLCSFFLPHFKPVGSDGNHRCICPAPTHLLHVRIIWRFFLSLHSNNLHFVSKHIMSTQNGLLVAIATRGMHFVLVVLETES